jgi:3-dehydroquinate synthase class II
MKTTSFSVAYGKTKISSDILGDLPEKIVKETCSELSKFAHSVSSPEIGYVVIEPKNENKTAGFCNKTAVVIERGKNTCHIVFENMIGQDVQTVTNMISNTLDAYECTGMSWDMCDDVDFNDSEVPTTPKKVTFVL